MILYFSGTGNSEYIAEVLNQYLNDEIINIGKELNIIKSYSSNKPYVFVVPAYAYRMPRIVEEFINNRMFNGNKNVYVVMTCGANTGNAHVYAKKLFDAKEMSFKGFYDIVMPDNYIVLYNPTNNEEALDIIRNSKKEAEHLVEYIINNECFPSKKENVINHMMSKYGNEMFYKYFVTSKGFLVNDDCVHCLKCVNVCPLDNIKYINKEIVYFDQCTHCMACINSCPKEAIEYKKKTKNRNHYHLHKIKDKI